MESPKGSPPSIPSSTSATQEQEQKKDTQVGSRPYHVRNRLDIPSPSLPLFRRRSIAGSGVGTIAPAASSQEELVRKSLEYVPTSPLRLGTTVDSSLDLDEVSQTVDKSGYRCSTPDSIQSAPSGCRYYGKDEKEDGNNTGTCTGNGNINSNANNSDGNSELQESSIKAGQNRHPIAISRIELGFVKGRDSARRNNNLIDYQNHGSNRSRTSLSLGRSLSPLNRWLNSNRFAQLTTKPERTIQAEKEKGKKSSSLSSTNSLAMDSTHNGSDPAAHGEGRLTKDPYDGDNTPIGSSEDESSDGGERLASTSHETGEPKKESPSTSSPSSIPGSPAEVNDDSLKSPTIKPPNLVIAAPEEESMYKMQLIEFLFFLILSVFDVVR